MPLGWRLHWQLAEASFSPWLGPPFSLLFFREGSPTRIDYSKKGTLIRTSLVEDLAGFPDKKLVGATGRE